MRHLARTAFAACALGACGGGTIGPAATNVPVGAALPFTSGGAGPTNVSVRYNATTDFFSFFANNLPVHGMAADADYDHGPFAGYKNAHDTRFGFAHSTGNATVSVLATDDDATLALGGHGLTRDGPAALPLQGIASYSGHYVGVFRNETTPNSDISRIVHGTATFTADFGNARISGAITDRSFLFPASTAADPANPVSDVTLAETAIGALGDFQGAVTGGQITVNDWRATTGTYEGFFAGPAAGELVGGVLIDHTSTTSVPFRELGGIHAN